jgi:hypothetical protein
MPSSQSPLDQPKVQKALTKRIQSDKYTASEIAGWVEDKYGITTTTDSLRRFRQRHGLEPVVSTKPVVQDELPAPAPTQGESEPKDERTFRYSILENDEGETCITVFSPGLPPQVAADGHPNLAAILEGAEAGDPSIIDLFDPEVAVKKRFEKLTERVAVRNGKIYFDNDPVDNAATQHILRCMETNEDFTPVVNFLEKVYTNPNEHSRNQLWGWLKSHKFTIKENGDIVGYKGVMKDGRGDLDPNRYYSTCSGKAIVDGEEIEGYIPNDIDSIIEMPREDVLAQPSQDCASGLHIGTWSFAQSYGTVCLEVHFNPRDVVSVPLGGAEKVRVCRYKVVRILTKGYEEPILKDEA